MRGLLAAGDSRGEVADCYTAKEAVRELYSVTDFELAGTWIDELIRDMSDPTWLLEVRSIGRTLKNWRDGIIAWHKIQISNGLTKGAIALERVKRDAFGFRSLRSPVEGTLYARRRDWSKLAGITPR